MDCIYIVISKNGLFKIGYTSSQLKSRIAHIKSGSPCEIELLLYFDGDKKIEKQLHGKYSHLCVKGEWFALQKNDLLSIIDDYMDGTQDKIKSELDEFDKWGFFNLGIMEKYNVIQSCVMMRSKQLVKY